MAIKKAVKLVEAERFIGAAPDSGSKNADAALAIANDPVGLMRGNKRQITLTLTPEMVPKIDSAAASLGISRAAWISMTISKALQTEE